KLMDDIQQVIERVTYKEFELETEVGSWLLARIMPYKTSKNVIDGVIITFTDISQRRKQLREMKDSFEFVYSIVQTVRDPLLVLDEDMHVVLANWAFYKKFKVAPEETIKKSLYNLGDKQWDLPSLK